jgi:hypothetical protein
MRYSSLKQLHVQDNKEVVEGHALYTKAIYLFG